MKILKLTLHKKAFEVMVTGEKTWEFRSKTDWIMSRLWNVDKKKLYPAKLYTRKHYDFVEFTNGYGKDRPYFKCEFLDFMENIDPFVREYSNGLKVKVEKGDQIIVLGKIVNIKNWNRN
ncbi:MAG TPA: hypothetical protein VFM69_15780 [Pricia sp.]|nr:hypothetical protein [Pricia sp.]